MVVTDNLFGDILTDLAAAVTGGIGLAAVGQHQPRAHRPVDVRAGARVGARTSPGSGVADPTAAILSAGLLLDHLGHADAAAAIDDAVFADLTSRVPGTTRDLGGRRRDRRPARVTRVPRVVTQHPHDPR